MKTVKRSVSFSRFSTALIFLLAGTLMAHSQQKQRPVPTIRVEKSPTEEIRYFPGQVRAYKRVELAFNVSGQLEVLNASEGIEVKKGDLLARLDQRNFQYALDAAKANFQNAKLTFDRKSNLFKDSVIPKADMDQAEALFLAAKSGLDRAKKAFEDTSLIAPFDALISKRNIENFEQVVAKRTVLSLQDVREVEVVLRVPEKLTARGNREDIKSIQVKFDADHDIWYDATLSEFASQANPSTKTFDAVVKLPSPKELNTFSGMTASVRVEYVSEDHVGGIVIPMKATFAGANSQTSVWVIPADGGNPVKTAVEVGQVVGSSVVVLDGLNEGDLVAVAGIHSLNENMQVRAAKTDAEGLEQ